MCNILSCTLKLHLSLLVTVFSPDLMCFMNCCKNVIFLADILLLASAKMAERMNENIPGVFVSQYFIDELAKL